MALHNQRFAKALCYLHRAFALHDNLKAEMVWREQRSADADYYKALFILYPTEISRPLVGKRVGVCDYPDGGLEIRYGDHALPHRIFTRSGR